MVKVINRSDITASLQIQSIDGVYKDSMTLHPFEKAVLPEGFTVTSNSRAMNPTVVVEEDPVVAPVATPEPTTTKASKSSASVSQQPAASN